MMAKNLSPIFRFNDYATFRAVANKKEPHQQSAIAKQGEVGSQRTCIEVQLTE